MKQLLISEEKHQQVKGKRKQRPQIILKNIAESKSESESEIEGEMESEQYNEGQYIVVQYQGKRDILYFAAVITELDEELYHVTFYKRKGKDYFLYDEDDVDEIGIECIKGTLSPPDIKQKLNVYYLFNYSQYNIDLQ